MKNKMIFMLTVLGAILPQTFAFADGYSTAVPEVPLMPGMEEVVPAGARPGETAGVFHGNDKMAVTYYFQHLQDDGWEPIDPQHLQYKRGEQTLGLGVSWDKPSGETTVRFKIWPPSTTPEQKPPTPEEILNNGAPATEEQQ